MSAVPANGRVPRLAVVLPTVIGEGDLGSTLHAVEADARVARDAGYWGAFLAEVHGSRVPAISSPLPVASWLLSRLPDLVLGTSVLAAPLHDPVRLAEDAIMLDWLGRGRFVLGLGAGHIPQDFALFGADHAARGPALEQVVRTLRDVFSGVELRQESRRGLVTPAPFTEGGPPLYLAASTPHGVRRAARLGAPWLADPQRDIDRLAALAGLYRQACAQYGTTPRVALFRDVWAAEDRATAIAEGAPSMLALHWYYLRLRAYSAARGEPWADEVTDRSQFTLDLVGPGRLLVGAYDEVARTLSQWCERVGADEVLLRVRRPGGPASERVHEVMAEIGRSVGAMADAR